MGEATAPCDEDHVAVGIGGIPRRVVRGKSGLALPEGGERTMHPKTDRQPGAPDTDEHESPQDDETLEFRMGEHRSADAGDIGDPVDPYLSDWWRD